MGQTSSQLWEWEWKETWMAVGITAILVHNSHRWLQSASLQNSVVLIRAEIACWFNQQFVVSARDDREWVFWFPLLPCTPMQSIPMSSHSIPNIVTYSHFIPMTQFPFLIPIPSCCEEIDAKHYKIKIIQFCTETAKQLNTSSDLKRLLPKNTLSMSPFTKSQFSCHFCT